MLKKFLIERYDLEWIKAIEFVRKTQQSQNNIIKDYLAYPMVSTPLQLYWIHPTTITIWLNNKQLDEFVTKSQGDKNNLYAHLLRVNDVLIFEEVRSPSLGNTADSNPLHRQAVRLNSVSADYDELSKTNVLNVSCIQMTLFYFHCASNRLYIHLRLIQNQIEPVSVAHGNIVLADHGYTNFNGELADYYNYQDNHGYTSFTEFLGNVPAISATVTTTTTAGFDNKEYQNLFLIFPHLGQLYLIFL